MKAETMQGDHPRDRVIHSWRCLRRAPLLETVRKDPVGQGRVCWQCQECGGSDMAARLAADRTDPPTTPPTEGRR